jgi:hypothetical protein
MVVKVMMIIINLFKFESGLSDNPSIGTKIKGTTKTKLSPRDTVDCGAENWLCMNLEALSIKGTNSPSAKPAMTKTPQI